jgi:hypothetical protein
MTVPGRPPVQPQEKGPVVGGTQAEVLFQLATVGTCLQWRSGPGMQPALEKCLWNRMKQAEKCWLFVLATQRPALLWGQFGGKLSQDCGLFPLMKLLPFAAQLPGVGEEAVLREPTPVAYMEAAHTAPQKLLWAAPTPCRGTTPTSPPYPLAGPRSFEQKDFSSCPLRPPGPSLGGKEEESRESC